MTNHNKVLSCYLQFKTNKVICSNFPKKKKKAKQTDNKNTALCESTDNQSDIVITVHSRLFVLPKVGH